MASDQQVQLNSPFWWTIYCPLLKGLTLVKDLINSQTNSWKLSLLMLYPLQVVKHIILTPPLIFGAPNKLIWMDNTSTSYFVRLGYITQTRLEAIVEVEITL